MSIPFRTTSILFPVIRAAERSALYQAQAGDAVRSYDFPHADDCYVEGVITHAIARPDGHVAIRVKRRVIEGKDAPVQPGECVLVPQNGTPSWLGKRVTDGIVRIHVNRPTYDCALEMLDLALTALADCMDEEDREIEGCENPINWRQRESMSQYQRERRELLSELSDAAERLSLIDESEEV